jgi:hypothetical protein
MNLKKSFKLIFRFLVCFIAGVVFVTLMRWQVAILLNFFSPSSMRNLTNKLACLLFSLVLNLSSAASEPILLDLLLAPGFNFGKLFMTVNHKCTNRLGCLYLAGFSSPV